MRQKKNFTIKIVFSFLLGLVSLLIWINLVNVSEVMSSFRNLDMTYIIIGIISYIMAYFIRSLRWQLLLKTIVTISKFKAFIFLMGGQFANYLVPLRTGELLKCYFVRKFTGIRMSQVMPSVFLDKVFDTSGIILILLLLPLLPIQMSPYLNYLVILIVIVTVLGIALLFSVMMNRELSLKFINKLLFIFPASWKSRMNGIIEHFVDGLVNFKKYRKLVAPVFLLSILAILFDSLFFYSLFLAFNKDVNYFYILFGYTLIYLSYIVPHPPAQVGSNELLMVLIFAIGFGMNREIVSGIMVFSHIITGIIIIGVGLFSFSYGGINLLKNIERGDKIYD